MSLQSCASGASLTCHRSETRIGELEREVEVLKGELELSRSENLSSRCVTPSCWTGRSTCRAYGIQKRYQAANDERRGTSSVSLLPPRPRAAANPPPTPADKDVSVTALRSRRLAPEGTIPSHCPAFEWTYA